LTPVALTIAGSDSGGGAGIQADLKTFAALGVYGTSAITAITAQNTLGVEAVENASPAIVAAQIRMVANDFEVAAAKTGMLASAAIITTVVESVRKFNIANLVVDTVMVSKSNHRLLAADAETTLKEALLPLAFIATPNLPEAEVLTGMQIHSVTTMYAAAEILYSLGAKHVLVKGGHLDSAAATDIFFDGKKFTELAGERIETRATHGTGCTLSAAITAYLAKGYDALAACRAAKEYLSGALRNAKPIGHGHGPVNHSWNLTPGPSPKGRGG